MRSVDAWIERAEYDIETARAMLDTGRYLYVLFCCQQAIEKALKAIIAKQTNEMPPRIHALIRLAELSGVELTEKQELLFRGLTTYYVQSRYPQTIASLALNVSKEDSRATLSDTEEIIQWLRSMI